MSRVLLFHCSSRAVGERSCCVLGAAHPTATPVMRAAAQTVTLARMSLGPPARPVVIISTGVSAAPGGVRALACCLGWRRSLETVPEESVHGQGTAGIPRREGARTPRPERAAEDLL